ncbi:Uncharacterized protein FWK35_00005248 [Aphis craccivora]|uniref:Uncharacterized protein n=1 Tax=Aphis craccivora TaxID=307492 RepID=A0A6G0YYM1_APHCR|nr:Uncharacterized protein FWK35_00005248 [Aphis craccivora]
MSTKRENMQILHIPKIETKQGSPTFFYGVLILAWWARPDIQVVRWRSLFFNNQVTILKIVHFINATLPSNKKTTYLTLIIVPNYSIDTLTFKCKTKKLTQLSTIGDSDLFGSFTTLSTIGLDFLDNIHTIDNGTKNYMFGVQPRCLNSDPVTINSNDVDVSQGKYRHFKIFLNNYVFERVAITHQDRCASM